MYCIPHIKREAWLLKPPENPKRGDNTPHILAPLNEPMNHIKLLRYFQYYTTYLHPIQHLTNLSGDYTPLLEEPPKVFPSNPFPFKNIHNDYTNLVSNTPWWLHRSTYVLGCIHHEVITPTPTVRLSIHTYGDYTYQVSMITPISYWWLHHTPSKIASIQYKCSKVITPSIPRWLHPSQAGDYTLLAHMF